MCVIKVYHFVAIWCLIHSTPAQRRIRNGQEVTKDKPYAVYFIKAAPSERTYKGWTCGGSIITPDFIITSAACVEDVKHLYVIAGYRDFVDAENINTNECTKTRKKKVILTCVPKSYELEFTKIEKWAILDIAVVQVESPYDFTDESYKTDCSYIPAVIRVNYERKYQLPGLEAMAMGWGHTEKWRSVNDMKSYNSEKLRYTSTTILDKVTCKDHYKTENETEENTQLLKIIDKYMICTLKPGNIDDKGDLLEPSKPDMEGCITEVEKLAGAGGPLCDEGSKEEIPDDLEGLSIEIEASTESHIIVPDVPDEVEESTEDLVELDEGKGEIVVIGRRNNSISNKRFHNRRSFTRRNGICQNDHGGPLVTWVGGHEVLIGVASVFKLVNGTQCSGPYLFTSTQCNGRFLDCLLNGGLSNDEKSNKTRRSCDAPPSERGFDMIRRKISWIGHPDGPAENEVFETRPQVPLSMYHYSGN